MVAPLTTLLRNNTPFIWTPSCRVLHWCEGGGVEHHVCFFSHMFSHHQLNYSVTEKETLSVI